MGHKIDKDTGHSLVQIRDAKRRGHFEGSEKGQDGVIIRWINDNSKICLLVEDVNLKLGSEEWLILRHLG